MHIGLEFSPSADGPSQRSKFSAGGTSRKVGSDTPFHDTLLNLTIKQDGTDVGEIVLQPARHPDRLAGRTVQLRPTVDPKLDPAEWMPQALAEVEHIARRLGIATLLINTGDAVPAAKLKSLGYVHREAEGLFCKDLISAFWRRSGVFIIAEAGSNWRMGTPSRDLSMAKSLIDVAAEAGADAVKFQTFQPQTVYVAEAGASDYLSEAGIQESILDIFADIAMPHDMLPKLAEHARNRAIGFMSTAFSAADFSAVDPLVNVHKIASYEITHVRLIELAARSGKPTLMSTGAATLEDVRWAVQHYHACGGRDLCLMQCTAKYPAPLDSLNLAAIPALGRMFGVPVGLSDHSREAVAGPLAATALGARAIEKHFTLDNRLPGPDHQFAVTPAELKQLVEAVRAASAARGDGIKEVLGVEEELALFAQRGVQALHDIKPGDLFREDDNVAILRPGKQTKGVHPRHLEHLIGKPAKRAIRAGEGLRPGDWA